MDLRIIDPRYANSGVPIKRADWLSNKTVKPEVLSSEVWSAIADEIVEDLWTMTRFVRVCKADKASVRLMVGACFFDANRFGVGGRQDYSSNCIAEVKEFNSKVIRIRVWIMNTSCAYEFTWKSKRLTRKQVR